MKSAALAPFALLGLSSITTACVASTPNPAEPQAYTPTGDVADISEYTDCPAALIDDLEDGNSEITVQDGRNGYWYTYADEDGTTIEPDIEFVPSTGGGAGTKKAARIYGHTMDQPKNVWAGMAFAFKNPKLPYDASKYKGIAFYARRSESSTPLVIMRVPDVDTDPEGGVCKNCFNDFSAKLLLTPEWKRYIVPFEELKQEPGWGEPEPGPALDKLYEVRWQINTRNVDYDIWIDEIRFVGCK